MRLELRRGRSGGNGLSVVMTFFSEAVLTVFTGVWIVLLLLMGTIARKKRRPRYEAKSIIRLHEVQPYIWLVRSVLGIAFILLFVVASFEASLSSFLLGLGFFPLSLIPIQVPVDAIGAFVLHRKGRHYLEQIFSLNFTAILPYLMIPPFIVYEYLAKRREMFERLRLEEFAHSLPEWMRHALLQLDRQYGHAKRRSELNLTTKRSRLLAEKGLAKENKDRELRITEFGSMVSETLRSPQAGVAGKEDVAPRMLGGRVLGSLPGVLRRIAS